MVAEKSVTENIGYGRKDGHTLFFDYVSILYHTNQTYLNIFVNTLAADIVIARLHLEKASAVTLTFDGLI